MKFVTVSIYQILIPWQAICLWWMLFFEGEQSRKKHMGPAAVRTHCGTNDLGFSFPSLV